MSAHTPGPWTVTENRYGIDRKVEYLVQDTKGNDLLSLYPTDGADEPIEFPVRENARLIAAAPELLTASILADRALRAIPMRSCSDGGQARAIALDAIAAAIAKSEGK